MFYSHVLVLEEKKNSIINVSPLNPKLSVSKGAVFYQILLPKKLLLLSWFSWNWFPSLTNIHYLELKDSMIGMITQSLNKLRFLLTKKKVNNGY